MVLQLVPILSFFFLLTSTTGAALWTARLEEGQRRPPVGTPIVHNEAEPAAADEQHPDAPPPPYQDNPPV
ncbi:hypothetical protein PG990_008053 [Apiospora arundinis]